MSFNKIEDLQRNNARQEIIKRMVELKRNKWIVESMQDILKRFDGKKITKRIETALKALNLTYNGKLIHIYMNETTYSTPHKYEIWFSETYNDRRWIYLRVKENETGNFVFDYQETFDDQMKCFIDIDNATKSFEEQYENVDIAFDEYNKAIDILNEADSKMNGVLGNYTTVIYKR